MYYVAPSNKIKPTWIKPSFKFWSEILWKSNNTCIPVTILKTLSSSSS